MMTSLWTASTGMQAQMTNIDTISNNLANVDTTGYKKSSAGFQDLLYQNLETAGHSTGENSKDPTGSQVGVGVKLAGITKDFRLGSLKRTDRELDVAISGRGFIPLEGPNGENVYTRDGNFKLSGDGAIVNADGYKVVGIGQVPAEARSINIGPSGRVSYIDAKGAESEIGQMQVAMFVNEAGLASQGGNIYQKTTASGEATLSNPGEAGSGQLQQYFVEKSNVSIVEEMVNLITAQRAYEINSKVIKSTDEMLQQANQL